MESGLDRMYKKYLKLRLSLRSVTKAEMPPMKKILCLELLYDQSKEVPKPWGEELVQMNRIAVADALQQVMDNRGGDPTEKERVTKEVNQYYGSSKGFEDQQASSP